MKTSNEAAGQLDLFSDSTSPDAATPSAPSRRSTAPLITAPGETGVPAPDGQPASGNSAKPPRVPFYDDDAESRRRRLEPTFVVPRPAVKQRIPFPQSTTVDDDTVTPPKRGRLGFIVTAAMLIGIGGGVAWWTHSRRHHQATPSAGTATTAVATTLPSTSVSADSAPSSAPSFAPVPTASATTTTSAPEEAVLSIESIPTHATILIGGTKMGTAPLEVKVPKGKEAIRLELRHPGYVPLRERVIPSVDQHLKLSLTARGRSPTPSASSPSYHKFD